MTTEYTPTPCWEWRYYGEWVLVDLSDLIGSVPQPVQMLNADGNVSEQGKFACRAVNSHSDLVHWLGAIIQRLSQTSNLSETEETEIELAEDALRLAKGET